MALDSSVYGSVGTPRIFIDYVQFCKATNVPISYYQSAGEYSEFQMSGDFKEAWNMNPAKTTYSDSALGADQSYYYTRWGIEIAKNVELPGIQKLLSSANYYAVLGHNFSDATTNDTYINVLRQDGWYNTGDYLESAYAPDSVLYEGNGYRVKTVNPNISSSEGLEHNRGYIVILKSDGSDFPVLPEIGAISVGRYLDMPNSPDLNLNVNYDYDGISRKRTIGGSDVVNVAYSSPPNWIGKYRPFTNSTESTTIGSNGRRSFELSFSYIAHDSVFPKNFNDEFLFSSYSYSGDSELGNLFSVPKKENILANFYTLTLGGTLEFLFQPDKTKDDFAICRLDKSSFTAKQVAHQTYDVSMTFVETW